MNEDILRRQYARFMHITNVQYNVVKSLKELSFFDFWRRIKWLNKDEIEQYEISITSLLNFSEKKSVKQGIGEENFKYLLEDFTDNVDVLNLIRGRNSTSCVINTSHKLVRLFFAFVIWSNLRTTLGISYTDLKLGVSNKKVTLKKGMRLFNKVEKITECSLDREGESLYINKKNFFNEIIEVFKGENTDFDKIFSLWTKYYLERIRVAELNILVLFVILNTPLYSLSEREKIVQYLRTTIFKYLFQQKYNVFKKKFPDVIDWKFCDYLPQSLEFPEDVKTVSSTEDDCPHNYSKEMLGHSDALKKLISKLKEDKYREVIEELYNYLAGVEINYLGKKVKCIECNKIDFIYLLGGELLEGECITDDPIIEWVEGTRTNMNGFFYALYGCEGSAYKELGKGAKKDCYCFMSNGARKRVNIKENHNKSIEYMKKWENLFKKIGDKVVRDSIGKK